MPRRSWDNANNPYWSTHVATRYRGRFEAEEYCRRRKLSTRTFALWVRHLVSPDDLRKRAEYLRKLRQKKLKRQRGKQPAKTHKRRRRNRYGARTDKRSPAVQAFWAMHVEAMSWSGLGLAEYAAALNLSVTSLAKWRDRFEDREVEIDWRALLHPSARAVLRTRLKDGAVNCDLTAPSEDMSAPSRERRRRKFSAEEKLAMVLESERPEETVSSVARRHGITTSMLFRWRAERGFGKEKPAKLATVSQSASATKVSAVAAPRNAKAPPTSDSYAVTPFPTG